MTRLAFIIPMLLLSTLMIGCRYTPGSASPDRLPDAEYPQIVTLGDLKRQFFYGPPVVVPERDGRPMRVNVEVRLKEMSWESDIPCQYRFIFLDQDGVALDPEPAWRWRNIPPRVKVTLQGSAPDIGAVDWRCEIRRDLVDR